MGLFTGDEFGLLTGPFPGPPLDGGGWVAAGPDPPGGAGDWVLPPWLWEGASDAGALGASQP